MTVPITKQYFPYYVSSEKTRIIHPRILNVKEDLRGCIKLSRTGLLRGTLWADQEKLNLVKELVREGVIKGLMIKSRPFFVEPGIWDELIRSGCINAKGIIHSSIVQKVEKEWPHDPSILVRIFDAIYRDEKGKDPLLDVDRLRTLSPAHKAFSCLSVRHGQSKLPPWKLRHEYINALIGRFSSEKEEKILEIIPAAESYDYLAEYYLAKGEKKLAAECAAEAFTKRRLLHWTTKLVQALDKMGLSDNEFKEAAKKIEAAVNQKMLLIDYYNRGEGAVLTEKITVQERINLALRIGLSSIDEKIDDFSKNKQFLANITLLEEFVRTMRKNLLAEGPYLQAILKLFEASGMSWGLKELLEMELTNALQDKKGKDPQDSYWVIVDNPSCPDGDPLPAFVDIDMKMPTPLSQSFINRIKTEKINQISAKYSLPLPDDTATWHEPFAYEAHIGNSHPLVFSCAIDIARLFSRSPAEYLDNYQAVVGLVYSLAERGFLANGHLIALRALGKRFPEYKGRLNEIIEKETSRDWEMVTARELANQQNDSTSSEAKKMIWQYYKDRRRVADQLAELPPARMVETTVFWDCHEFGWLHRRCLSVQPQPWYEKLLADRYSVEEIADLNLQIERNEVLAVPPKKCLILDCDGVLWQGIADESSQQEIVINRQFQDQIKKLMAEGVLLALNTKNDRSVIEAVFAQHPEMPLKLSDFVAIEANWEQKADNMLKIAAKINLGLDSFVFIDDTPQEREMARAAHPQIFTPELPVEAEMYTPFMAGLSEIFGRTGISAEDAKRTELYAARDRAEKIIASASTREQGLLHLEMKASIRTADEKMLPRLVQLSQRTNQFNLTNRRYQEHEIAQFMLDPNYKVFALHFSDKYAEAGIVGLMVLRKVNEGDYLIDVFNLSCRVIGRTVEKTFMAEIVERLKREGVKTLRGLYVPSARNEKVKELYATFGFKKISEEADGRVQWELELERARIESPVWITVET